MKPVVEFVGAAVFDTKLFEGHEVAHVFALNHPVWEMGEVRTSEVLHKFEDGSFETRNTTYKPSPIEVSHG
jgi:hypothetical protein